MEEMNNTQISAMARLFSSGILKEFGKKGKSPAFSRLATQAKILQSIDYDSTIADVYDYAFSVLQKKNNRHEYIYKSALTQKILLGIHNLQTATMLTEFRAGKSKADVVILNGTSSVYEIKTDRDSLSRLQSQIESYTKIFDKINIIVGEKYCNEVLNNFSTNIGILLLSDRFQISEIRKAESNLENIEPLVVLESLRRNEAVEILEMYGYVIPDMPNTEIFKRIRELFALLTPKQVHDGFVKVLKKSRSSKPLKEFLYDVPPSLQAAAISIPFKKLERTNFQKAVKIPIKEALLWA